jgi:hypothetical protein
MLLQPLMPHAARERLGSPANVRLAGFRGNELEKIDQYGAQLQFVVFVAFSQLSKMALASSVRTSTRGDVIFFIRGLQKTQINVTIFSVWPTSDPLQMRAVAKSRILSAP